MKAVIFDYNGVLADDLGLHFRAYAELARRHGSRAGEEDIRRILSTTPSIAKIELIAGTADPSVTGRLMQEKTEIYVRLAKEAGVLFPSARAAISSLSKKYLLAIVTNSTREQIVRVFPRALLEKFRILLTYEDIPRPKPAPDSLLLVMGRLGVAKQETCYVGDAPPDMQAAKAAGILAIGIPTGLHTADQLREAGADVVIASLSELEKTLEPRARE